MPPATIGPYRVDSELGRGGMGVVYLARDIRLDRRIAIKALPPDLAGDQELLGRFRREARVLASLNHPNIGAIYGLEESDGRLYLVLEYVEGETLAARLRRSRLSVPEALALARQIAEALEAAHEKGIVHRDLKPGNVMVTADGAAKVLDFGLARTAEGTPSATVDPDSPTVTTPAPQGPTIPGVILGTAGYMSPEQARGSPVDKRSDIFSFGCVLFEMLTGARPFGGETVADSLSAVLRSEPDWALVPADVPARLRDVLEACLVKDRRNRLHDIGDARLVIERAMRDAPEPASRVKRSGREAIAWAGAVAGIGGAAALWMMRSETPGAGERHVVRFTVQAPPGTSIDTEAVNAAISPDGRHLAFIAGESGRPPRLWVRDLASHSSRVIDGTEGAAMPFWSPDGNSVGYFAQEALWRVSADGGPAHRLADAPGGRGGAWSHTGVILFAPLADGPLCVVPQSGGPALPALDLQTAFGETGHRFPQFLPGGRRFVYSSMGTNSRIAGQECTFIASLDAREGKQLIGADSRATYADPGWLLYDQSGVLYAQRMDLESLAPVGQAFVTGIVPGGTTHFGGHFAVSASGTGAAACTIDGAVKSQIVEFGPGGTPLRTLGVPAAEYQSISVSASGTHAVSEVQQQGRRSEFRLIDLTRDGVWNRLVDESYGQSPRWSGDGKWVYYSADRKFRDLFRCALGGSAPPEPLLETGNIWANVRDASSDWRLLIFSVLDPKNGRDLWLLELDTKAKSPIAAGPNNEFDARFSPDGRLLAIAVSESGDSELYVQTFPQGAGRVRVSGSGLGALNPGNPTDSRFRWSTDGSSLFYLDADGRTLRSAKVTWHDDSFRVANPEVVMKLPPDAVFLEIGPDAKTAYGTVRAPGQPHCSIAVTLNWEQLLEGAPPK